MSRPATASPTPSFPTVEEFQRLNFDADAFNHEAHVYVGWCLVTQFPLPDAIHRFADTLKRLTHSLKLEGKYHETITWFFMILIAERQSALPANSWEEFAANNRDLIENSKTLLSSHYSNERLWSQQARQHFLMPDIAAND